MPLNGFEAKLIREIDRNIKIIVLNHFASPGNIYKDGVRFYLSPSWFQVPRGGDRCEKKTNNLAIIYNSNV